MRPGVRHKVEVSFELNETCDYSYVREFIVDALEAWGGQRRPDDPLFGSLEKVRVKMIRESAK